MIAFLIGVITWGIFGRLEVTANSVGFVNDGLAVCYVDGEDVDDIDVDKVIDVGGELTKVISVSTVPIQSSAVYDAETLSDLGLSGYEMMYAITAKSGLPDGSYNSHIVVERIHPMSFIIGDKN